ncbi:hypothetical protein M3Y94_00293700 [Aphelenchoides besseyi]|nr:hypothetical protein M3Y94_00293700 [Aphelenchoides besseyi]
MKSILSVLLLCIVSLRVQSKETYGIVFDNGMVENSALCDEYETNYNIMLNPLISQICKHHENYIARLRKITPRLLFLSTRPEIHVKKSMDEEEVNDDQSDEAPEISLIHSAVKRRMFARIGKRQMYTARVG